MARNFYRRIEVVFPVEQDNLRRRIIDSILSTYLADTKHATQLRANGSYKQLSSSRKEGPFSAQETFIEEAIQLSKAADRAQEEQKE